MRAEFRVWHDGDDLYYIMFNQESVDDALIVSDLKAISGDKLDAPTDFQMIGTNEVLAMTKKKKSNNNNQKNHKNHKNNNHKQNNYKKKRY